MSHSMIAAQAMESYSGRGGVGEQAVNGADDEESLAGWKTK